MSGRPVRISIIANGKAARSELMQTGSAAGQMGEKVSLAGKVMKGVFAGMGGWFAATEVAHGIKDLVSETSKFQSQMTLLQTAGGEVAKNMGTVSDGILKMAGQTGTSISDLSEGMYTVEKAAYRGADGLKVLKAAAEGARAENVDMGTMTTALTSIMTSYHAKAGDAVKVTNEMVAASGEAKTTMQEFAASLATVLPVASANHISFAQVGGALATLTQHGTSAAEATVELSNTIRNLAAPNQVAQKEMQQLGINVTDLSTHLGKRGLTGTLNLVMNAIGKQMGPAGTLLLKSFKQSQSATHNLKVELDAMPKSLRTMSGEFESGKMSYTDYYKAVKGLGGQQYALGKGFISTFNAAKGFNNLLTSGQPAAQTFTDALKKMLGGATGLNTALQLTGENADKFKARVKAIGEAGKQSGADISTWTQTQATFAVQFAKLKNTLEAAGVRVGMKFLPWVSSGLEDINNDLTKVGPALSSFGHVIGDLGKVVGAVPGPLKSMGVEALILVPVLSRVGGGFTLLGAKVSTSIAEMGASMGAFSADVNAMSAEFAGLSRTQSFMTSFASNTTGAATRVRTSLAGIGTAAKAAAGIGGMLALQQAAGQTNHTLSVFESTAGAAMLGLSVGGLWGAAIGGGVGLLASLSGALHKSTDATDAQSAAMRKTASIQARKGYIDSLTQSLNANTGAVTANTRQTVANNLEQSAAGRAYLATGHAMGLTSKQLISMAMGTGRLSTTYREHNRLLGEYTTLYGKAHYALQTMHADGSVTTTVTNELRGAEAKRFNELSKFYGGKTPTDVGNFNKTLRDQNAANAASAQGFKRNALEVRGYIGSLKGLPKNLAVRVKNIGVQGSMAEAKALTRQYHLTPTQVSTLLKVEGLPQSKANIQALVNAMKNAKGQANADGSQVGANFGDGLVAGIRSRIGNAEAAAAEIVNRALKGAAAAQQSRSPAKKTIALGKYFGDGYALGIQKNATKATRQAEQMVIKALKGAHVHTVSGLHTLVSKDVAKANTDLQKQIDKASKLYGNVRSLYLSVRDTITSSADITQFGANPVGVVSFNAMMAGLKKQAADTTAWAKDIKKLTGEGLNKTTLQQLLNAGPASISTVEAMLTGGKNGIKQINTIEKQLAATSTSLGKSASKSMYGVGLNAAKGMMDGLNKDKRQFDKWATDLGNRLTKSVKKALGIKSPSRVFKTIGTQTAQGLIIGLDSQNTYVARSGAVLASQLQKGFGTPALDAYTSSQGAKGGNTYHVTVQAGVGDPVAIGKQVRATLDAYEKAGGRKRAA